MIYDIICDFIFEFRGHFWLIDSIVIYCFGSVKIYIINVIAGSHKCGAVAMSGKRHRRRRHWGIDTNGPAVSDAVCAA